MTLILIQLKKKEKFEREIIPLLSTQPVFFAKKIQQEVKKETSLMSKVYILKNNSEK